MISWIQTRFKKHTKAFLVFLLIVVAIPFVFSVGGGASWMGGGAQPLKRRDFFGHNIASQVEVRRLTGDARVGIMLRLGYMMPVGGAQLETYAYQRTASLALADQFHIPQPTTEEINRFIATLRLFQNEHGVFDSSRYSRFRDEIAAGGELKASDVARVLAEEIRIHQAERLLAGPGYVAPAEIASELKFSATQWFLQVAVFDLSEFASPATPPDNALAQYFEDNAATFEIPERVRVDYVRFPAEEFVTNEPINEAEIAEYFEAHRDRFAEPGRAGVGAESSLANVHSQVEMALRTEQAGQRAAAAASDFAYELYEKRLAQDSTVIDELIAKHKGQRATAPLFSRQSVPAGVAWTHEIVDSAFGLDATRYFSDALPFGPDHIVLLWRETLPKTRPRLEEVRSKVLTTFLTDAKNQALRREGVGWKRQIEATMAGGRSFYDAAGALAGTPRCVTKMYGPFTRRQQPDGLPEAVVAALGDLPVAAVSPLVLDKDHAYYVLVAGKLAPMIDPQSIEYVQVRERLAALAANTMQEQTIDGLVKAELARSETSK